MFAVVQAIPEVSRIVGHAVTVIGGLAVIGRLGGAHRATTDLDTVQRRRAVEVSDLRLLLDSGAAAQDSPGAWIKTPSGPVRVDVIEVRDVDLEPLPEMPNDRLFYLSHIWAAATATPVHIRITDPRNAQFAEATVKMAEPGPLIAMKLQSVEDRSKEKAGTDLLDIVRLTLSPPTRPTVLAQCARCDEHLAKVAAQYVKGWFATRAIETRQRIRAVGGTDIDADDIALVQELLTDSFSR
jgi:hypothetical protein